MEDQPSSLEALLFRDLVEGVGIETIHDLMKASEDAILEGLNGIVIEDDRGEYHLTFDAESICFRRGRWDPHRLSLSQANIILAEVQSTTE